MGCADSKETKQEASKEEVQLLNQERRGRVAILEEYWAGVAEAHPFTKARVFAHNTEDSLWLLIHGRVYESTEWLKGGHPGGARPLMRAAGRDSSSDFDMVHGKTTKAGLNEKHKLFLGYVFEPDAKTSGFAFGVIFSDCFEVPTEEAAAEQEQETESSAAVATAAPSEQAGGLNREDYTAVRVSKTEELTHNTRAVTVAFENSEYVLPMQPGGHISLEVDCDGAEPVYRSYSPVDVDAGKARFVVKAYDGGLGSGLLHRCGEGDTIKLRGPIPPLFDVADFEQRTADDASPRLLLVAGGTGVAPILSILRAVVASSSGHACAAVLCFRNKEDELLAKECRDAAANSSGRATVDVIYSQLSEVDADAREHAGRISAEKLTAIWGERAEVRKAVDMAVVCGPPGLNSAVEGLFKDMGFDAAKDVVVME
jgi:ferredoxin-NADP reductase